MKKQATRVPCDLSTQKGRNDYAEAMSTPHPNSIYGKKKSVPDEQKTTNELIESVLDDIDILIQWANADKEASIECEAKRQASDDQFRIRQLTKAKNLITQCYK